MKKQKKLLTVLSVVTLLFLMGIALMSTEALAQEKLIIGATFNLTGDFAAYDIEGFRGAKLAVKMINEEGGVAGKWPIELIYEDSRSEVAPIIPAVKEFLAKGAQVIHAGIFANQQIAGAQVAYTKGLMTAAAINSGPTAVFALPPGYIFLVMMSDNQQGAGLAEYAAEAGIKRAFLLRSKDETYFDMFPWYFAEAFKRKGGEIVGETNWSVGSTDYSGVIAKIKSANPKPEIIVSAICCGDNSAFIKQLRAAGVDVPFWGSDATDDPTFLPLGDAVEGIIFTATSAVDPKVPEMEKYAELYEKEYGNPLEIAHGVSGWEFIHLVAEAVKRADSLDPNKIRETYAQLKDIKFPIGSGSPFTYAGMPGYPKRAVAICQIKNGKKTFVKWIIPSWVPDVQAVAK